MIRLCWLVVVVYLMSSFVALIFVPMSNGGLLGLEPDPLSGLWAVLLSMPWPMVADPFFSETNTAFNLGLLGIGMSVNALILVGLCMLLQRLFPRRHRQGGSKPQP